MNKDNLYFNEYDDLTPRVIPGYELNFFMSNLYLSSVLGTTARILCIGSGTNNEVLALSQKNEWYFYSLDPSKEMIRLSDKKIKNVGMNHRVELICGGIDSLMLTEPVDAATLFLVLARVSGNENKVKFLSEINKLLKLNGYFVYLDIFKSECPKNQKVIDEVWISHGLRNNINKEFMEEALLFGKNKLHINTLDTTMELFSEAGFENHTLISSALPYRTYIFQKTREL